ncbi:MAG: translation initiation factor IF-2 subunit beta, partial [Candidatus Poseidoniales archaeon]
MSDFDYESLLDRARENIPEEISSRSRWRLPEPQIMIEGQNTIFRNFNEVVSMMDRDDNHVYQYLLNELGTSGS